MHCESVNEMAILPELAAARPAGVDRRAWPGLTVVKQRQSPVMTTIEEFHEVGPGLTSSHTIGPIRITCDFYQRATSVPAGQLAAATALKVPLLGEDGLAVSLVLC